MLENIGVVILAAGEASRFGSAKQLALWQGKPLLQHMIDTLSALGVIPYLALGAHYDTLMCSEKLNLNGCHIVRVENWNEGVGESIRVLTRQIQKELNLKGVLFFLADQPLLLEGQVRVLINKIQNNPNSIVCSLYSSSVENIQTVGVPAYFPRPFFEDLCLLKGGGGAKSVILANDYAAVDMKNCLVDVDEPEDLVRLNAMCD